MSRSDTKYYKQSKVWPADFAGFERIGPRYDRTYIYGSNTWDGEYQDLIVWEQLTDAARVALNDLNNFGKAEVPFNDEYFEDRLAEAWPF
ncbi:Necrosis inducing protein [Phytophthora cactorum]|nr:Necrosis inducing protein [Phytophthora cactorum]